MLGLDPPDHTRLRRLAAKAFTPKTVENLRPDIVRLTDELLDQLGDTADVIAELALPLPMAVIGEMLGIPASERVVLQPFVRDAVETLELDPPLDQLDAAAHASKVIAEHIEALIAARRAEPTDDLLSELVHVEEQGDQLSHDELISTVILLFGAGFETTTNLIGNGLLALLEHPAELQRLRDDRALDEDRGRGAVALGRADSGRRPQGVRECRGARDGGRGRAGVRHAVGCRQPRPAACTTIPTASTSGALRRRR